MRRWAIALVALAAATGFVRLGVWQLDRLAQRRAFNAMVAARRAAPELSLVGLSIREPAWAWADSLRHRSAVAEGVFDFGRQVIVMARARRGVPGVVVVTPLRLSDSLAVLVERGWAPSPNGRSVALDDLGEPQTARVVGELLAAPVAEYVPDAGRWPIHVRSPDPNALQSLYPYRLFPLILRRSEVPPGAGRLLAVPAQPLADGPHLSYAVQWFAFAVIAVVGAGALLWREGAARGGGAGGMERRPVDRS